MHVLTKESSKGFCGFISSKEERSSVALANKVQMEDSLDSSVANNSTTDLDPNVYYAKLTNNYHKILGQNNGSSRKDALNKVFYKRPLADLKVRMGGIFSFNIKNLEKQLVDNNTKPLKLNIIDALKGADKFKSNDDILNMVEGKKWLNQNLLDFIKNFWINALNDFPKDHSYLMRLDGYENFKQILKYAEKRLKENYW